MPMRVPRPAFASYSCTFDRWSGASFSMMPLCAPWRRAFV